MPTPTPMPMQNDSTAYDLSLFEPRQAKVVSMQPNKKLEKAKKNRIIAQSLVNTAATVMIAAAILAVMCVIISTNVQLTELQGEIRRSEDVLSELESENVRLIDDLTRKTSAKSVDEYVSEVLGMRKIDPSQIAYIQVNNESKAVISEPETNNILGKLGEVIKNFFTQLVYLFE